MDERATHRFVADGRERALAANGPGIERGVRARYAGELSLAGLLERWRIEREVRARYAGELGRAGLLERWRIEGRIRREIQEELTRVAPPGALY